MKRCGYSETDSVSTPLHILFPEVGTTEEKTCHVTCVLQQQRTDDLLLFLPDSGSALNFRGTKAPQFVYTWLLSKRLLMLLPPHNGLFGCRVGRYTPSVKV